MSEQENTQQPPVTKIMAGRDNAPNPREQKIKDLQIALQTSKKVKPQK